jgi:hypothetical protein
MINLKNYSKVRVILAIPLVIFALVISTKIVSNYDLVNYYVVIPYFIGTILFVLNRKWSDYICFAIIVFCFSAVIAFWSSKNIFQLKDEELFFFVLAIIISVFLLKNTLLKNK